MRALLALLPLLVVTVAAAAPAPEGVVAHGIVAYTYERAWLLGNCAGDGPFSFFYDAATRVARIAGSGAGCVPIFSFLDDCEGSADGPVTCERTGAGTLVTLSLDEEGNLDYVWKSPSFRETIVGKMDRTPFP